MPRSMSSAALDDPALDRVDAAISDRMLAQHEPLPAVVMDRGWNLLRVNAGARRLFAGSVRSRAGARLRQRAPRDPRARARPDPDPELVRSSHPRCWSVLVARPSAGCSTSQPPSSSRSCGPGRTLQAVTQRPAGRRRRPARSSTCTSEYDRDRPALLLGGVHDRHARRCHRPRTTGRGVLPRRRPDDRSLARDRRVMTPASGIRLRHGPRVIATRLKRARGPAGVRPDRVRGRRTPRPRGGSRRLR